MPELVDKPAEERASEALFTVTAGEGDGFMLGVAAGDSAGGAWDLGYSAITEQAVILAYELITAQQVDRDELVRSLLEMDGIDEEEPVFRAETPEFRGWLDRARSGRPVPGQEPCLDAAYRAVVLGVTHRRSPEMLIEECVALGRLFHDDEGTVLAGVMAGAAVAASCFAQSGLDLIAGVAETTSQAVTVMGSPAALVHVPDLVRSTMGRVGITDGGEALEATGGDDPVRKVLAGILLAAPVAHRHHVPIEQAARIGGSSLGAVVGGIVGARVGIRAWPWAFANDTWFAEIGRRVVRGPAEVDDLPIPYAVEQHLMSGGRPGFH
jgi:ADP-ribosylglycohydrolase